MKISYILGDYVSLGMVGEAHKHPIDQELLQIYDVIFSSTGTTKAARQQLTYD